MTGDFFKYNGANLPSGGNEIGPLPRPRAMTTFPTEGEQHSVFVNKKPHRIRFEGETESAVVVIIEPK